MADNRELILSVLRSARGRPLSLEDVLNRGAIDVGAKKQVQAELRALAKQRIIIPVGRRFRLGPAAVTTPEPRVASGRQAPKPAVLAVPELVPSLTPRTATDAGEVIGTLTRRPEGYGFIALLHGGDDLFVPPSIMADAMDGDLVAALPTRGRDGRSAARTMRVVERRRQYAVGTYRHTPRASWVEPRDQALGHSISVKPSRLVVDGDVMRVRLDDFERGEVNGTVVSRLGQPGDPDVEVLSVAYAEGFADIFPPDATRAAEETPDHVRVEDKVGRRDLTTIDLVTIDGEDARDFDDAVYVEKAPRGFRLVVAIADVTHYVQKGSALDREALRRTTSVYFPRHVLPMLPERLSNGICSLNPNVERLCMVADMAMDHSGHSLDTDIYPAVMKSRARCTYTEVAALVDGKPVPKLDPVKDMLGLAATLASRLTRMRMERGAIDFDLPEGHVSLDETGGVQSISKRPRNVAHRLIEELMLAANEAVARYFDSRALPTVYRVHGSPKEEKLHAFVELAKAFGYDIDVDQAGRVSAAELNAFLHRVEGRPEQRALNHLLLRSMMQAVYSAENIGHFGLAAPSYLHFTSPIRRYPDLIVHRLLKEHWARGGRVLPEPIRAKEGQELQTLAEHCSERERAATSAEREIDAFYATKLMERHVGERFSGTIAAVAEFGLFVELNDPFVQGLIRAETIADRWKFDPDKHRLVIGDGTRSYGVGDAVEIEVQSANPITRRIELSLVEGGRVVPVPPRAPGTRAYAPPRRDRPDSRGPGGKPPDGRRPRGGKPGGGKPGGGKPQGGRRPQGKTRRPRR
jgi:ribonuclease R